MAPDDSNLGSLGALQAPPPPPLGPSASLALIERHNGWFKNTLAMLVELNVSFETTIGSKILPQFPLHQSSGLLTSGLSRRRPKTQLLACNFTSISMNDLTQKMLGKLCLFCRFILLNKCNTYTVILNNVSVHLTRQAHVNNCMIPCSLINHMVFSVHLIGTYCVLISLEVNALDVAIFINING